MVITLGAALLGWIGGGMMLTDPATPKSVAAAIPQAGYVFGAAGALLVVVIGKIIGNRQARPKAVEIPVAPNNK
jgi:predicted tellurium resistance membrane protein TerC